MTVIPATQEAEVGRLRIQGQLDKASKTLSLKQKPNKQKSEKGWRERHSSSGRVVF
jgi:hypothetical protein